MKVYVVEVSGDEMYQCGMSLNHEIAKKECDKINARWKKHGFANKARVTTYELNNKYTDFC